MRDGDLWAEVAFDERGLVATVVQDALTGEVRMVAYMNREALSLTVSTGLVHFWSRSRKRLWKKGETSGNTLAVRTVHLDCDGDTLLVRVEPTGPSCHTGAVSCFSRRWVNGEWIEQRALAEVEALEETVVARRDAVKTEVRSYSRELIEGGAVRVGAKLQEEAVELARAVENETDERVVSEAADVVYHLVVGLALRRVSWRAVLGELGRRSGVSGLVEKASRGVK